MKHLIDEREPITLADIDQAIADGRKILAGPGANEIDYGTFRRLLAIVEDTYGKQAHGPQFRGDDD